MRYAFRDLLALIFALVQFLAMGLCLMVCLGGISGLVGAPSWMAAAGLCVYATSAVVCGYGCFIIYRNRLLTIGSTLISIYACLVIWYFWGVVLPSFHG